MVADKRPTKCQTRNFNNLPSIKYSNFIYWLSNIQVDERLIYSQINVGLELTDVRQIPIKCRKGCTMVEYISMKNGNKRTLRGVDRNMMDWMRYHTIQDLRDLAFEMYNRGEDISGMVQLIHEMDGMAHVTHMANENRVYDFAEYDILSYVEECEKSYV